MAESEKLPHEPQCRSTKSLEELISAWQVLGRECLASVDEYVRRNPAESLAIAFLAGTSVAALIGKRR